MPRWSKVLTDANGKFLGRVCGSSPRRQCSVPECHRQATIQCDYPVQRATATRKAKSATCDRWLCERCAKHVGDDTDYCPVHARAEQPSVAREPAKPVQIELGLAPPDLPRERWKP